MVVLSTFFANSDYWTSIINAKKNISVNLFTKNSVSKVFEDMKILTVHELYVYELIKFLVRVKVGQ